MQVSDFGLSTYCMASHISVTRWSTVSYMAPEAFEGHLGMASDVYSFGVMLWEMYTGGCGTGRARARARAGAHAAGRHLRPPPRTLCLCPGLLLPPLPGAANARTPGAAGRTLLLTPPPGNLMLLSAAQPPARSSCRRAGQQPYTGMQAAQIVMGVQAGHLRLEWPFDSDPRIVELIEACIQADAMRRPSFLQLINMLTSLEAHIRVEAPSGDSEARMVVLAPSSGGGSHALPGGLAGGETHQAQAERADRKSVV